MAKERENLKRLKCLRRYRQRYGVEALLHRQLRERRVLATDGAAQQVRGHPLDGSLLLCFSGSDPKPMLIDPSCKDSRPPALLGFVGALCVHALSAGVSFGLLTARKTLRVKSREGKGLQHKKGLENS